MTIFELINQLHGKIREFCEQHWPGFRVTKIIEQSASRFAKNLVGTSYSLLSTDVIFDVTAECDYIERRGRVGFTSDGNARMMREEISVKSNV